MTFVLDLLAETLQNRREEIEATENAELEPAPWDVVRSAVGDEMIDPALRSEPQGAPQTGPHRQHPDGTPAQRKAKYACIVKEACNTYGLRGSKRLEVQDFSAVSVHLHHLALNLAYAHLSWMSPSNKLLYLLLCKESVGTWPTVKLEAT
jgi:hypothetical protein